MCYNVRVDRGLTTTDDVRCPTDDSNTGAGGAMNDRKGGMGDDSPHTQSHDSPAAYHKAWRQGPGREKYREAIKRYRDRHPEKNRAHRAVDNALRAGKLTRGACAEAERGDCLGRIEAHHEDYARPLEVTWLCKRHHRQADAARQAREAA